MLTTDQLTSYVGKVVRFLPAVDDLECGMETGMLATVVQAAPGDFGLVKVVVDFAQFEEHNKLLMTPNFYDSAGNPTLRWCDANSYPKDRRETLFVDPSFPAIFELVEPKTVQQPVTLSPSQVAELRALAEAIAPMPGMASEGNAAALARTLLNLLNA